MRRYRKNRNLKFRHLTSDYRPQTFLYKKLTLLQKWGLLVLPGLILIACGNGNEAHHERTPPSSICKTGPEEAFGNLFTDTYPPLCQDSTGSGAFGSWFIDPYGLPAYLYTMDHHLDPRANYFTSWGLSNDHWHQLGNDTITVTAHNQGYLQYWDWRRGGKCINRYQPEKDNLSGGFRFVKVGETIWNTLYDAASFAGWRRVFGTGYVEKETTREGITLKERIYVPNGKDPLVLSETEVRNLTDAAKDISLYEYWDFNLYELLTAPIMTAPLGKIFEEARWRFNGNFEVTTSFDPNDNVIYAEPYLSASASPVPEDAISVEDYYPRTTFLASLTGTPQAFFTDQDAFFGSGGPETPDAVHYDLPSALLPESSKDIGKACLVFRRDVHLEAGEEAFVSYAFGSASRQDIPQLTAAYRRAPRESFSSTAAAWSRNRVDFVSPEAPWLRNELLWHGYYLASGSFYEEYFGADIINQGSAYAYIQGLNGAHRDFALFCIPMVYLRPDLAREILTYTMRSQDAYSGEIPYAHQGYGFTSGMLVHEESTDLDLFFLMAVSEYLGATRDFAFLEKDVPYYPLSSNSSGPVRDHLIKALDHLEYSVKTGPHGLIRAGTGDWNDVLIAFSPNPILTNLFGESNLNTAMACLVLPRIASLLKDRMPSFSERLSRMAEGFAQLLPGEWTGQWMRRGYLGNGAYLGEDQLFLDAQPWALLAGIWNKDQARTLLDHIHTMLVDPSPAGALCLYPPNPPPFFVPGSDTNGGTWAAVDSWLVWAWSLYDPKKAWECFLKSTLHQHAEAYPDIWYGVWSGPDSFNAFYGDRPGETFNWTFTPMTDFPVMNMNRHSGPLLDAIRLAGIDPCGERITIDPVLPFPDFSLRLPLMGIAYLEDRMRGYYNPLQEGTFRFRVRLPHGLDPQTVRLILCGVPAEPVLEDDFVLFEHSSGRGETITWEVRQ